MFLSIALYICYFKNCKHNKPNKRFDTKDESPCPDHLLLSTQNLLPGDEGFLLKTENVLLYDESFLLDKESFLL
jgi:hypothetical protein